MSPSRDLTINSNRLLERLAALARIGAIDGGGVCRLALSDEDKAARNQVVDWMRALELRISVDRIGNIFAVRQGSIDGPPVMAGSHLDTVQTGGKYDGAVGVLAGLEVIATLNDAGLETTAPLAVGVFTNEEGVRFAPDMMGSMVHQNRLALRQVLAVQGIDGTTFGEELVRIGYDGNTPIGSIQPRAYVELHIEQGPVLEREQHHIGAVEGVQGISWSEFTFHGVNNHAGTTPMHLRHDAGYTAACAAAFVRELAQQIGDGQVATVGRFEVSPGMINVVPDYALMTADLRNMSDERLAQADRQLRAKIDRMAASEGVRVEHRSLARFPSVRFDADMIALVEREAHALGASVRRMPSGAGHDAQSFAPHCPTGMIFVPSVGGVSHNIEEYTADADIILGANVLLRVLLALAK